MKKKGKLIYIGIDLIEEIREVTISNPNFDINLWCERDAKILEAAAHLIRQELSQNADN